MNALDPNRWDALWRRHLPSGSPTAIFWQLQALYDEPIRRYHNGQHIADCLREFDCPSVKPADPGALEFAIWFHDAIYDSRANDNEERSAALASACITDAGGSPDLAGCVHGLVLATKTHDSNCAADATWMIDIDLSIFGRSDVEFDAYESAIRAEYAWVAEPAFREGRGRIVEAFLARPQIFVTTPFRSKYEIVARANLLRSIEKLKLPLP